MQAPKGGTVSVVNGQWYNGGEFLPLHGLFCGRQGEKRRKAWDSHAVKGRAIDLGGTAPKLWKVQEYTKSGWLILGVAIADTERQAIEAFGGTRERSLAANPV